jgi:hypothetical protein
MISLPAAIPMWNAALHIEQRHWPSASNIINYYSTPNPSATNQPITTHNMAKSQMSKSAIHVTVKYQSWVFFTRDLPSNVSPMHVQQGTSQLLVFRYCICKQGKHPWPMISLPLTDHAQELYLFVPKFIHIFHWSHISSNEGKARNTMTFKLHNEKLRCMN